jgi:hypothetical protein
LYYVFFDTVDLGFISGIAEKYFNLVVQQLIQDYSVVKQAEGHVDADRMKEYFNSGIGKMLAFLDCFAYLGCYCSCQDCCDNHRSVLASDQLHCVEIELAKAKKEFLENFRTVDPKNERPGERRTFQCMAQNVAIVNRINVEEIRIKDRYSNKSVEYLNQYTQKAKRFIKKKPHGFKYIMYNKTAANSHYPKFQAGINYSALTPCSDIS